MDRSWKSAACGTALQNAPLCPSRSLYAVPLTPPRAESESLHKLWGKVCELFLTHTPPPFSLPLFPYQIFRCKSWRFIKMWSCWELDRENKLKTSTNIDRNYNVETVTNPDRANCQALTCHRVLKLSIGISLPVKDRLVKLQGPSLITVMHITHY